MGHADHQPTGGVTHWSSAAGAWLCLPRGGFGASGRPASPFQPMGGAGLEGWTEHAARGVPPGQLAAVSGCKWREDGAGLEFDWSHEMPGIENLSQQSVEGEAWSEHLARCSSERGSRVFAAHSSFNQ